MVLCFSYVGDKNKSFVQVNPKNNFLAFSFIFSHKSPTMPKKIDFTRKEVKQAIPDWDLVDDCCAGQRAVKANAFEKGYLPKLGTELEADAMEARNKAYKDRAVFYNVTGKTKDGMVGQVFAKDGQIEMPPHLEVYLSDIDGAGTRAVQQSKIVLSNILKKGHGGLLSDFPSREEIGADAVTLEDLETKRVRPRILYIEPKNIINWRVVNIGGETTLSLVMIREDKVVDDDGYEYKTEPRWRELRLITEDDEGNPLASPYAQVIVWKEAGEKQADGEAFVAEEGPHIISDYAGRPFTKLPFSFIGAVNNEPEIDKGPLLDIANLNIAHFRNSADHEETSHICGQATPVFSGLSKEWAKEFISGKVLLGSRSAIPLPEGGSADLLQADPNDMPSKGMEKKEEQMKALGAKLIEPDSAFKGTATEAIMEESSESSVLSSATKNVSDAYEKAFLFAGMFIAETTEDSIVFELNSDFAVNHLTAQERAQVVAEWMAGLTEFEEARAQLRKGGVSLEEDDAAVKERIASSLVLAPSSGTLDA